MRFIYLLLLSICLLGTTSPEGSGVRYDAPLRSGKDYALFFAVNDYQNMTDLTNPIQNARDIAAELRNEYGFKTEVVENPSLTTIEQKLAEYKAKFASGTFDQKGQLLIFFTGHGTMQGRNGYFMPSDVNPNLAHRTGLDYDYLRYQIDNFACQHIMVTVDACHSGTFDPDFGKNDRNFGRKGSNTTDQVLLHHDAYRARLFITSDAEGNETPDNSNLARKFLLALRSHRSQTGYLTHDELMGSYLKQANPIPGGGEFGSDESASRFLFFRTAIDVPVDARADIAAWNEAKVANTCAAYRNYLQQFANGDFAGLASQQLVACEAEERMLAAWAAVRQEDKMKGYEDFLDNYPNSPYTEVAKLKVEEGKATMREILLLGNDKKKETPPDNMIFIPGGTFEMGDQFGEGGGDGYPLQPVRLSSFYLSRTELTFAEYDRFCAATGRDKPDDEGWGRYQRPVINVSWYDAVAYCNWWSEQSGYTPVYTISGEQVIANWSANGYRLPTEAEWEYAARGGGKKQRFGNGQDVIRPTEANFDASAKYKEFYSKAGTDRGQTVPVGSFTPNRLGLADMSGNVWEWCWDWSSVNYRSTSLDNPKGPETGWARIFRDGGWSSTPKVCRATNRNKHKPSVRSYNLGVRLARSSR